MGGIERSEERDRAVEAALPHVPLDGWTRKALRAGLADAGFDPADLPCSSPAARSRRSRSGATWPTAAWPKRWADSISPPCGCATAWRRRSASDSSRTPGPARPRRATALLALPHNAPAAARITARTVDAIWRAIGDRSADFSWYTKRASLAAIYGATMLYWLRDDSEGAEETLRFLDRRIEALMLIPKAQRRLGEIAARLPDPFGLLARLRRA